MVSTKYLSDELVRHIHDAAVRAGLSPSRGALLAGIDPRFVLSLPTAPSPSAQLLRDLMEMNQVTALTDGTTPLFDWLSNAMLLAGPRREAEVFRTALEAAKRGSSAEAPSPPLSPHGSEEVDHDGAPVVEKRSGRGLLTLDVNEFWARPEASELHDVLQNAYDSLARIQRVAAVAGVGTSGVRVGVSIADIWFDLLNDAIRAARLGILRDVILRDAAVASYHRKIRDLIS